MRSTFHGLEVAKRGLYAQQSGLNTISHNVSNANTPGYSRQIVDTSEYFPLQYPGLNQGSGAGQLGQGVDVLQIRRIRDSFLDAQYRNENRSLGEWEVKNQTLTRIEKIINEPSETGLATVINEFFNAWHDLSNSRETINARKVVKQKAIELVESVNHIASQLSNLDSDLKQNVSMKVQEVNDTLSQIQELNRQITMIETSGDRANDLRDQRDMLVDEMSKMADVKVTEVNSAYNIAIGGQTVLQGSAAPTLITFDPATGSVSPAITSGEIKGLIEARVNYVNVYQVQLDALVNGLVQGKVDSTLPNPYTFDATITTVPFDALLPDGTALKAGSAVPADKTLPKGTVITVNGINGLHQLGYTFHDPAENAPAFFTTKDGATTFTALNIDVNSLILADENYIATSTTTYLDASGNAQAVRGNGDIALMIGEMVNQPIDYSGTSSAPVVSKGTIEDYFQSMIGQLGVQSRAADRMEKNQEALTQQIDNQRKSISEVSIDEEMANMIKFQHAYNASARIITMVDSILDKIINGMGLTR